jgi:hypothetical protein
MSKGRCHICEIVISLVRTGREKLLTSTELCRVREACVALKNELVTSAT